MTYFKGVKPLKQLEALETGNSFMSGTQKGLIKGTCNVPLMLFTIGIKARFYLSGLSTRGGTLGGT